MSNVFRFTRKPSSKQIEDEAAAWLIALDKEAPTRDTLREFHEWLDRGPQYKQVFEAAAETWSDLDRWSTYLYPETGGEVNTGPEADETRWRLGGPGFAAASLVVAGLLIAVGMIFLSPAQQTDFVAGYQTDIGEIKGIDLPDGSDIHLNTATQIEVTYAKDARVVQLTGGEAYFRVAHDSDKPFLVHAGRYLVKAVGTAFSVAYDDHMIELNVTEGKVEVVSLQDDEFRIGDIARVELTRSRVPFVKGQSVRLGDDRDELGMVLKVEGVDVESEMQTALAWRNGMLIFDAEPLQQVVAKINRYTPKDIVIADASIRDLHFGGYFQADNIPAILATMGSDYGLNVVQQVDGSTHIYGGRPDDLPAPSLTPGVSDDRQ